MAVNKVIYNNETLIDLTTDTVTADKLLKGYTAHNKKGEKITGTHEETLPTGTKTITANGSYDVTDYATATVNVPVPSGYVKPTGTLNITENGEHTVTEYEKVNVNVTSNTGSGENTLKKLLDATKSCNVLFDHYTGTNFQELLQYNDTENVKIFTGMFGYTVATKYPPINTNSVTRLNGMFQSCTNAIKIDISHFYAESALYGGGVFNGCYSIKAVIIRSFGSSYPTVANIFNGCYHILGTTDSTYNPSGLKDGYIYVPRDMITKLKSASNWSKYGTQYRALEDYTVDGTTTGEFDDEKAGI